MKGGKSLLVFEYRCKIKLKKNVSFTEIPEKVAYYLNSVLGQDGTYLAFHKAKGYKGYCHDYFWPLEKDGIYKAGNIYTVRVRMIKQELAEYFSERLPYHETNELLGVGGELKIIPKKIIETIYTLTPVVIKNKEGYWRGHMSVPEFEERMKINLIKKYKYFIGNDIDEQCPLYDFIEFKNEKPIKVFYKGIVLLGDKISLQVAKNETAQKLAYLSLATGVCENNYMGSGFMNYRYI